MGTIEVYISDQLERKFREVAMKLFGYGRGLLGVASGKAFSLWLSHAPDILEISESIDDPVDAIYGMLSHVRKTRV